ncbi:glycosyltransferase [Robertmurraya sp. GLU-23]
MIIIIVCTSICANYLPKAAVLAKSLKANNPSYKMVVCLVEKEMDEMIQEYTGFFDEIILAKNLNIGNFNRFIFRYDIVEASTAVKGELFKYLLEKFPLENKFMYLDPDIKVFNSFITIEKLLDNHPIILTPHLCTQELNDDISSILDNELSSLKYGVFNLGFLAISRNSESEKFIEWWSSRLNLFCYDDMFEKGIFTDQKWINLAPCLFDVYILKDLGYNVAPWNVSKRVLSSNLIVNEKYPLTFFHFSGSDSGANEKMLSKYVPDSMDVIHKIRREYVLEEKEANINGINNKKWSYGYFSNGEKINKEARRVFRDNQQLFNELLNNPFQENNESISNYIPKSLNKKKLYIWGTGSAGINTLDYFKGKGIEVFGWIDSNKALSGQVIKNMTVYNPKEFFSIFNKKEDLIILGTSYYKEILPELIEQGMEQNSHFIVSPIFYF